MSKLPVISGETAVKAFCKIGYFVARQRGSHVRLIHKNPESHKPLAVPLHKELDRGLLRALIRTAGISSEEFVNIL